MANQHDLKPYLAQRPVRVTVEQSPHAVHVSYINDLARSGRASWLGLLAYLAFAAVTVLGIDDADFFLDSRQTELPLVGVSIPTFSFFIFGPTLATALFGYLHLQIRKLIQALLRAAPLVDGDPLERHLVTWQLIDMVLQYRRDSSYARRPLDGLVVITTALLIWAAGPIVLSLFWYFSWPAHSAILTSFICLCFGFCIYIGLTTWSLLRADPDNPTTMTYLRLWVWIISWLGIGFAALLGLIKTETGSVQDHSGNVTEVRGFFTTLAAADFSGIELPDLAIELRSFDEARAEFFFNYCERHDIPQALCVAERLHPDDMNSDQTAAMRLWCQDSAPEEDDISNCLSRVWEPRAQVVRAWETLRRDQIALIERVDWEGRDLRNANLAGLNLRGANLIGVNFAGADLSGAELEQANLSGANLVGATLRDANMQFAIFSSAIADRAIFDRAQMEGVDFSSFLDNPRTQAVNASFFDASMLDADFGGANLQNAFFSGRFSATVLRWAAFDFADLQGAYFRRADLRRSTFMEAHLEGANLDRAILHHSDMRNANLDRASLQNAELLGAFLVNSDLNGAVLVGATLEGANLGSADLVGALLWRTNLRSVDLFGADLSAAELWRTELDGAILTEADHERHQSELFPLTGSDDFLDLEDPLLANPYSSYIGFTSGNWGYGVSAGIGFSGGYSVELEYSNTVFIGASFFQVDLSSVAISQDQIDSAFADASVVLPADLLRPVHWSPIELRLETRVDEPSPFHDEWHAWQDTLPDFDPSWRRN